MDTRVYYLQSSKAFVSIYQSTLASDKKSGIHQNAYFARVGSLCSLISMYMWTNDI